MNLIADNHRAIFFSQSALLLIVMANNARIQILGQIVDNETSVGALCEMIGLSQSATSQHLAKLRDAGLVSRRRDAQTVYYCSTSDAVRKILDTLQGIFEQSHGSRPEAA
jgi:DNA-binding transcriptional ArsR family regulator